MKGDNPCNICKHTDDCDGCILDDLVFHSAECNNYDCMLNYDCGCLLNMDEKCKSSTCFKNPGVWVMDKVDDEDEEEEEEEEEENEV